MWKVEHGPRGRLQLRPTEPIEGLKPEAVCFYEALLPLRYIFEIETDLGQGVHRYNLYVSRSDNSWHIVCVDDHADAVTDWELIYGLQHARRLIMTIPQDVYNQLDCRLPLGWVRNVWNRHH